MSTELIILIDQTKLESIRDLRSSLRRHKSATVNSNNLKWEKYCLALNSPAVSLVNGRCRFGTNEKQSAAKKERRWVGCACTLYDVRALKGKVRGTEEEEDTGDV